MDTRGEALRLIRSAKQALENALSSLSDAKSYGVWDLLGGGIISGLGKHASINEAKRWAQEAQFKIASLRNLLSKELPDLQTGAADCGGTMKVFDVAMDSLIADILVQSRIADFRSEVKMLIVKLDTLEKRL